METKYATGLLISCLWLGEFIDWLLRCKKTRTSIRKATAWPSPSLCTPTTTRFHKTPTNIRLSSDKEQESIARP